MDINAILPYLKHPDDENEPSFFIENNWLLDKNSTSKYKLVNTLIDFEGTLVNQSQEPSPEKSLLFQLNRIFSQNIDFIILTSLFAGGGIGFKRLRKRLIQWYASLKAEPVLFLEPEDKHLLSSIGAENCITVMDLEHRNVIPKLDSLPDLNASFENIPIKSESFNIIISYFVLEHVKNPQCHFKELSRILKPGGHLIVAGPGDVYPSHRIPYNYYNLTRYSYQEMIN